MNRAIVSKYGIHLAKPRFSDFALEVADIGIHYHYNEFISCKSFGEILNEYTRDYPPEKYHLEVLIVVTKERFLSPRLVRYFKALQGKITICYSGQDLVLGCGKAVDEIDKKYFDEDADDHHHETEECDTQQDLVTTSGDDGESLPLMRSRNDLDDFSTLADSLLAEELNKLSLSKH